MDGSGNADVRDSQHANGDFPTITKWVIDDVLRAHRPDKLIPLTCLATLAFLLQHGFNSLRSILNNTFEQKAIFDLRSDLYSHIQLLPLRRFDDRAAGDLMTRVIEDVDLVERGLIEGIDQGAVALLQVFIAMGMMFYLDWQLTLLALLPFPLLITGVLVYTLAARRRFRLHRTAASDTNAILHDNLAGVRQIKSFVREKQEHARFNRASNQLQHAMLVVLRTWAIYKSSRRWIRPVRHQTQRASTTGSITTEGLLRVARTKKTKDKATSKKPLVRHSGDLETVRAWIPASSIRGIRVFRGQLSHFKK